MTPEEKDMILVRDQEIADLKEEVNSLKLEIEKLTLELDKVKDIPSRVLNNGDKLI